MNHVIKNKGRHQMAAAISEHNLAPQTWLQILVVSDLEHQPGFVAPGIASLESNLVPNPTTQLLDTKQRPNCWRICRANMSLTQQQMSLEIFPPAMFEKELPGVHAQPSKPRWQFEPDRSHAMKDDTTRYPRTMVVFAIVMLGTGVVRYALPFC